MHSIAVARAKTTPGGAANTEREAAEAVNRLRQHVLAGWRDPNWMRTDPRTKPLRQRADFQELLARMDELGPANATAKNAMATPDDKLAARRKILTALEALAGPLPVARFIRRNLAQTRQDLAQALLDAGQVEEARKAFDLALAVRQKLVEEAPTNEPLRTDLVQSQVSTGDLLAAAGRLKEAGAAWEKGLTALEADLKANPNSFPLQAALSEQLAHVAYEYGRVGLFPETLRYYRRAFEAPDAVDFWRWYQYAVLLVETGAKADYQSLADRGTVHASLAGAFPENLYRVLLVTPAPTPSRSNALMHVAEHVRPSDTRWDKWIRGFARVRLGEVKKGLALLEEVQDPSLKWPAVALAQYQLGDRESARQASARRT